MGVKRGTSHKFLYEETQWETLSARRDRAKLIQMFKIVKGQTSETLYNILPRTQQQEDNRARRQPHNLPVPRHNTELLHRSFVNSTIPTWNRLPAHLKAIDNIDDFKRQLKSQVDKQDIPHRHYIGDRKAQILHNRLRSGNCDLNDNLYRIKLSDNQNCNCGAIETIKHYFLECNGLNAQRDILTNECTKLGLDLKLKTLLNGDDSQNEETNIKLFKLVQEYIIKTKRF